MPSGVKTDAPPCCVCPAGGTLGAFFWVSGVAQIQGLLSRVKRSVFGLWVGGGVGGAGGDGSAPGG